MSKKEKLIQKLKAQSKSFSYEDAKVLLEYLNFLENNKGKTSGSRVMFSSETHGNIMLHKPHPQKERQLPRPMADALEVGACKSSS